jgi:hypothetical protein
MAVGHEALESLLIDGHASHSKNMNVLDFNEKNGILCVHQPIAYTGSKHLRDVFFSTAQVEPKYLPKRTK